MIKVSYSHSHWLSVSHSAHFKFKLFIFQQRFVSQLLEVRLTAMIFIFNKTTVEIIDVKISIVTNHLIDIRTTDDKRTYVVLGNQVSKLMRRLKTKLAYFTRVARFVEMIFCSVLHKTRQPGTVQFFRETVSHGACKEEWSKGFSCTFLLHLFAPESLLMQFQRPALPLHELNLKSHANF